MTDQDDDPYGYDPMDSGVKWATGRESRTDRGFEPRRGAMRVNCDGRTYQIGFEHGVRPGRAGADKLREWTACVIRDSEEVVARATVMRHYKDAPNREKARKFALAAVLEQLGLPKDRRELFWKAYLGRKNVKEAGA